MGGTHSPNLESSTYSSLVTHKFNSSASVERIESYAFFDSNLESITFNPTSSFDEDKYLPGLTSIGMSAFEGTLMRSIKFPSTLEIIDEEAFSSCLSLNDVAIPSSVEKIGREAFSSSNVMKVVFSSESSLRTIENGVVQDCKNLRMFLIPSSVEYIEDEAFRDCSELRVIRCLSDSNLRRVRPRAFDGCYNLAPFPPLFPIESDDDAHECAYEDDNCDNWSW